jgi:hypothetical protein
MSSFQPAVGGDFNLPGRRCSAKGELPPLARRPPSPREPQPGDQLAPGADVEGRGRTEVGLRRPRATPSAQLPRPGDRVLR